MEEHADVVDIAPMDEHNTRLVGHVHPVDRVNPEPADRYNLVVIGGGTAGLVSAAGAAGLGAKVALVERGLMGGDCLNVGCVPSKGLIRAARAAAAVRDAGAFGVRVASDAGVDFAAVMERMRRIRAEIAPNDSVERFTGLGIDVFLGQGRFNGPRSVEVGGKTLRFSRAVIATGARAAAPPIPGLAEAGYLTNETIFSLTELPKRLLVIGGGPIGSEMAQSFARFGSEVHLVELAGQILPKEPAHIAAIVAGSLESDGVDLRLSTRTAGIEISGSAAAHDGSSGSGPDGGTSAGPVGGATAGPVGGEKVVTLEGPDGVEEIRVDEILVSVGRAPNVDGLGLEEAGVDYDGRTGVTVNGYLQTSNRRVYAAGDIASPYKFTHVADAQAAIVIQNALFLRTKKASSLIVPWTTYTDPEVAHVGLYPADAADRGIETDTFTSTLAENDRAMLDGEADGLVEVYTKRGTDSIVGATIVASHAGEMIGELTVAMEAGAGLSTISSTIHPYPTQSDAIRRAAREYYKSRLTPRIKRLIERWMAWRR